MRRALSLGFGLALYLLAAGNATSAETPATSPPAESESQQFARNLLLDMARFLGGTQRFSVDILADFDVVQDSGQTITFAERRSISLQRPNQFLSTNRESNGRGDVLLFDGEAITISDVESNVFSRVLQPGDIDASAKYFTNDLKMRLPLAPLFMSRLADELQRALRSVEYVEETDVYGVPAHQIAARTDSVDFQVWIRDGSEPVPLRVVISYRGEPGQPQFRAQFSNWQLKPRFDKQTFVFKPTKDMQQIVFLVQLTPPPADGNDSKGVQP